MTTERKRMVLVEKNDQVDGLPHALMCRGSGKDQLKYYELRRNNNVDLSGARNYRPVLRHN